MSITSALWTVCPCFVRPLTEKKTFSKTFFKALVAGPLREKKITFFAASLRKKIKTKKHKQEKTHSDIQIYIRKDRKT